MGLFPSVACFALVSYTKYAQAEDFLPFETNTTLSLVSLFRPVARGGSVGSDEPPSQTKGPLFYAKRSTFYNTGPLFTIKGFPLVQLVKQKVHYKDKMSLTKKVHQHLYKRLNIHTKYLFLFIGFSFPSHIASVFSFLK